MPSYTFNSNTTLGRHPTHFDGRIFVALLLIMLILGGGALELFWRSRGHYPVVADTVSLWGTHVDRVLYLDSDAVVIVGSSRVQLGLDPAIIKERLGASDVVQLARAAASPMPTLEYLADETDYSGLVICGVTPGVVYDALQRQRTSIEEALEQRENRPFYTPVEERLLGISQGMLSLNNRNLSWKLAGNGLLRGNWPDPPYAKFYASRYIQADYSRCNELETLRNDFLNLMKAGSPMSRTELQGLVEQLAQFADVFKARGGRLVLVRMPSSGILWETEQRDYPTERFWRLLKERFGEDAVHFHALEKAAGYTYVCPDGSHLNYKDAERISADLCERIKQKKK